MYFDNVSSICLLFLTAVARPSIDRKSSYSRRKKEEGRRKKEEAVIAMVSAIKNVLTVLAVAIF
jgi:hypothetical protein